MITERQLDIGRKHLAHGATLGEAARVARCLSKDLDLALWNKETVPGEKPPKATYRAGRTMRVIASEVAAEFQLSVPLLRGSIRTRAVAWPRMYAMRICRQETNNSLVAIGRFFGGRNHATVHHACERFADEEFRRRFREWRLGLS